MASTVRIKRSSVTGNPGTLAAGELAYSALADTGSNGGDRLYIGMGTETSGNAANHVVIGGKYFTDTIIAATNVNTASTLVKRNSAGDFAANIITASLLGNASTASAWNNSRIINLSGDATASWSINGSTDVSSAFTLSTVNSTVGTFGSATAIPVFTVNAKGLITGVTTANISTSLGIAGSTGTGSIILGTDTLTIAGGTGVTSAYNTGTKTVSLSIGQAVATTSDVTFNSVTVNGTFNSNDITAASVTVAGDAIITGNLTVQGTTTTINSTTLAVGDVNIVLAKDAVTASAANGAGLTVNGAAATFTYTSVDDRWNLNKNLNVTTVYGALVGNADTSTKWATARNLSLTGDATATLGAIDGTASVSTAITLASVNSNVGTFGSGTSIPTFTVNAKGLITSASATTIATATTTVAGLASFDSSNFTVTSGVVTLNAVDGGTY